MDKQKLQQLTCLIRYYILQMTTAAGSGHATSSLSAVELMTTLYFKYLRFNLDDGENLANDRVILSKGHASPLFYVLYAVAGKITEEELKKYRTFESNLEGHPSTRFPYTEVPTGSLGQGLSAGVGMALAMKRSGSYSSREGAKRLNREVAVDSSRFADALSNNKLPTVFVLLGDGEMAEGQNWEAIQLAAYYKLNNLIAILDVNRLGQSQETMLGHDPHAYAKRVASFGWRTYVVEDGHDLDLLDKAYSLALEQSEKSEMPAMIIAKTVKGKGVSFLEDRNGWHGKSLNTKELQKALVELGDIHKNLKGNFQKPALLGIDHQQYILPASYEVAYTSYKKNEAVSTRKAYGDGLVRIGKKYPNVVVLDGDVRNSTYAHIFAKIFPERFFESFIAEQNMVSMAVGLASMGYQPFVSTFGAFFTRAFDQLRMAALAGCNLVLCGSHAGVSVGEDGPSQMALQDLAQFRTLPDSMVFYPSDAISTERLVELAYHQFGITYIRTTRGETPVIYREDEEFVVGGSKLFYSSSEGAKRLNREVIKNSSLRLSGGSNNKKIVTIIAVGITLHEALRAKEQLEREGIAVRVIDCYSIKPIDTEILKKAARESKAIITVEDHYSVGGLGDAVLEALAEEKSVPVYKLAVTKTPRSGKPEELLDFEEIDAKAIVKKVYELPA